MDLQVTRRRLVWFGATAGLVLAAGGAGALAVKQFQPQEIPPARVHGESRRLLDRRRVIQANRLRPHPLPRPLAPGDRGTPFNASGWVNARPSPPGAHPARVILVDVWAPWCFVVRDMTPGLVRLYSRYRASGVQFVSLTNMPRPQVASFDHQFSIPWPSGYGAADQTLGAYGALRPDPGPSFRKVTPSVYLIGRDGRVCWSDHNARYRHEPVAKMLSELDGQIRKALRGGPPAA